LLGCFLFSNDEVFKKIGVLSGGERNRYAIAKLLTQPSNFVLLDEPTNHLDMRAKEVLLNALRSYEGTVVFVSHDRYFMDELAKKVFEIGGGRVTPYPGNYEEYLSAKQREAAPPAVIAPAATVAEAVESKAAVPARRLNPMKVKQLEERCVALEAEIGLLEMEAAALDEKLATQLLHDEARKVVEASAAKREKIERLTAEWEAALEQLS
jgi:ATP-binding cassette subfamily F protein 3